jgi:ABC-type glutathione transport system ATPase component
MVSVSIKQVKLREINSERILLENIRFELEPGKIYTILGKNGSGKSTLVKSLTGLLDGKFYSVDGNVFFEKEDVLAMPQEKLLLLRKNKIKYVFQDAANSFDPLRPLQYYFDLINQKNETGALLEYFLLPKHEELFKLHSYEISGGMAQRVSIVLSLLARPRFLILDEPTSGIDPAITNLVLLKLKDFVLEGNSVLLVTQDIVFAEKISDRISYLSGRKLTPFYDTSEFFKISEYSDFNFLNSQG